MFYNVAIIIACVCVQRSDIIYFGCYIVMIKTRE